MEGAWSVACESVVEFDSLWFGHGGDHVCNDSCLLMGRNFELTGAVVIVVQP